MRHEALWNRVEVRDLRRWAVAVAWTGNRAFLNAPADPAAGPDTAGARNYDPLTGRFTSVDPVRAAGAPLLPNGYGYTAGTPVTSSDPSGAMVCDDQGRCGGVQAIAKAEKAQQAAAPASHPASGNGGEGDGGGGGTRVTQKVTPTEGMQGQQNAIKY